MVAALIALVVVFAWWAPRSWLGRKLNGVVARVERRLALVPKTAWIVFLISLVGLTALVAYGKFDGAIMAGMAAPEVVGLIASIDIGLGVEMIVAAWVIAAQGRWRSGVRAVRTFVRTLGVRTRRATRARRARPPANDDDDEPAGDWTLALAA